MPTLKRLTASALGVLPQRGFAKTIHRLSDLSPPRAALRPFVKAYVRALRVNIDEAEVPRGGFRSFDEFFTRPLRQGARPVDRDPAVLVSPSDGKIEDIGIIDLGATFRVKHRLYDVAELVGDSDVSRFDGGFFAVIYLSPRDYHRVHAPAGGDVTRIRHVPGALYPVNALSTEVPRLLARNERVAVFQRSADHGGVVTVLVGALGVGRISVSFDPSVRSDHGSRGTTTRDLSPPHSLDRGDELGMFHLGSTAVVLVEAAARLRPTRAPGDTVRFGEPIARRADA